MPPDSPVPQPEQVAAFFQKHRTGLVTLVFTDLVDSTALLHQLGDQAGASFLRRRRQILREVLHTLPEAEEIETAGDSFLLVFAKPSDAVRFALQSQARLRTFSLEAGLKVQERMGIHLGEVVISERETEVKAKDLYGIQLAACARVMSLAMGGQVLLTRGAFDSARQVLKGEDIPGVGGLRWVSHGPYLLKGIEEPVEVCEVAEAGEIELAAPKTSEKAQRQVRADEEPVLGWRPAVGQEVPNTRWLLEKKLGEGGFGEVWLGRHQHTKERRVFKFCFQGERVRYLKREMTLFRLLKERVGDHPHIVRLHDVFLAQPPFYVEMDYVEGADLRTWCQEQGGIASIPMETRLEIIAQAAEGLQGAHEAGIIHRDIKPANILVGNPKSESRNPKEGRSAKSEGAEGAQSLSELSSAPNHPKSVGVKLTDFGIGQVESEETLKGITRAGFTQTMLSDSSSSHTGTQLYMAPELIAGKPASTRSDLYSLGVVLYQLAVGDFAQPVTGDWAKEVQDPLLREDLQRCLAGKPQDRFAGADQLAKHLRTLPERRAELAQREADKAALERSAYRRGIVRTAVVAGVIVVALMGLAMVALNQSKKARASADAEKQLRQRAEAGEYAAKTNLLSRVWDENDIRRMRELLQETAGYPERGFEWYYWQRQAHLPLQTLRGHLGPIFAVAFSPSGAVLATGSEDHTAKLWDAATGKELHTFVGHGAPIGALAFSSDGERLVTGSWDQSAKLWEVASGKELLTLPRQPGAIDSVAISADGRRIIDRRRWHSQAVGWEWRQRTLHVPRTAQ
jgi:serine/threonine-protein kinase